MMRQYELVDRVRKYNPHTDEDLLNRAYVYAMRAHGAQKRASGDPYFTHPLEVAAILTEMKLDDATIVAAVLHDTIEDTGATRAEIDNLFGQEIGNLVDGLTKLKKLDLVSKRAAQAENFRKLLLAIAEDVRVLLVKLADRLHNMRTLHYVSPEKRARIAEETLDIYAPLAGRMGMQSLRDELENLSFKYMMPEAFAMVSTRLADLRDKNQELIATIEKELTQELALRGIKAGVRGRQKQPYSVWSKMERKSVAFEQLSDIFGFRVVVDSADECYRVVGVVHTKWPAVPGRFKDYISTPKQNDYRSIHTTVVGPGRQRVELQVRTREMHDIARYGIAAHALYKDGRNAPAPVLSHESNAYQWLKRTIDLLADGDNPEEFLEHTRLELFHDQVFCFTPKGRLIALPRGATAIDFAYAVHTSVGNSAVGVKINGRLAPLLAPLSNGDEVEIVRAEGQTPPAAWESIAVTGKARSAIRRASRDAVRKQYAGLGRQIVLRAFERGGKKFSEDKLRQALPRLARAERRGRAGRGRARRNVFRRRGQGGLSGFQGGAQGRADSPASPANPSDPGWFGMRKGPACSSRCPAQGRRRRSSRLADSRLARRPAGEFRAQWRRRPGDRIVGIMTPGEGITVYPIQSSALAAFDDQPERWLDVRWDVDEAREFFPAKIIVAAINEPGSLGAVA